MVISHLITILSWLIFGMAGLSFSLALGLPTQLPVYLQTAVQYWLNYIHLPILEYIPSKYSFLIDFLICAGIAFHSLIRQKSRLKRSHKDLAVTLTANSQAIETLGLPLNLSDTKAINKLIERAKSDGLVSDAPNLPRPNWFFTAQSSLMIAALFSGSVWLFIRQVIY